MKMTITIFEAASHVEATIKKHLFPSLIFIFAAAFCNAQTITFVSENNSQPLAKVLIFGKDGTILAQSDLDGKIERNLLIKSQEKFQLVYNNKSLGSFLYSELDNDIVKLTDRESTIQEVIISNKPAKYIYLQGNFNSYITVNQKLNCYVDGVITYVFDNKTKALKNTVIEEYRIFTLADAENDRKNMSSIDYKTMLELPNIAVTSNPEKYKTKFDNYKESQRNMKDELEFSEAHLQNKEFSFLGYRVFDMRKTNSISYEKDSQKALKNLLEYNLVDSKKMKHKSESNYHTIIAYQNFYPTELSFNNNKKAGKTKLNISRSNYQTKFWTNESFPNLQTIFKSYFKDDLKEKPNQYK